MNRTIKFRQWDSDEKYMSPSNTHLPISEHHSVMQFTGLLDSKGKEIYEGDIIRYAKIADWAVIWDERKGSWRLYDHQDKRNMANIALSSLHYKSEIIGNIYENPTLLTEEKK